MLANLLVIGLERYVADGNIVVPAGCAPDPVVGERLPGERLQGEAALHGDVITFPCVMLLVITSHHAPDWNKMQKINQAFVLEKMLAMS